MKKQHKTSGYLTKTLRGVFAATMIWGFADHSFGQEAAAPAQTPDSFHACVTEVFTGTGTQKTAPAAQTRKALPKQNATVQKIDVEETSFLTCVSEAFGDLPAVSVNETPQVAKNAATAKPAKTNLAPAPEPPSAVETQQYIGGKAVIQPVSQQNVRQAAPAKQAPKKLPEPTKTASLGLPGGVQPVEAKVLPPVGANADFNLEGSQWSTVGPFRMSEGETELKVIARRSKLLRTKSDLVRTAIVDPSICDIVQFTPREISIIGKSVGATHVTFWFKDSTEPVTFLIKTTPDPSLRELREREYKLLEQNIAKLFPNSKVKLTLVANKLLVSGQAKSAEEAADIMRVLRSDATARTLGYQGAAMSEGALAASELDIDTSGHSSQLIVISRLRVPGVHTVELRVKLAELARSNSDNFGINFDIGFNGDKIMLTSLLGALTGGTGSLLAYDCSNVRIGLDFLKNKSVVRKLSESTLVTLSGTSASLVSGGEIPVPSTVGISGASAVTTNFRSYGTVITFTPYVMDKDLIRLNIATEFSSLDDSSSGNSVSGVPNLKTKSAQNQVIMREGQTFVVGTALEDSYQGTHANNIPVLDFFGHRNKARGESEMVILVSPELVAPMEPDEVPPLPGFDVTEPTNAEFLIHGRLEGNPTLEYRSTVWPNLRRRYINGGAAMISGPYGH